MIRQIVFLLTILPNLAACDFNTAVKDRVDQGIEYTKAEMNKTIYNSKSDLEESFNLTIKQSTDSNFSTNVTDLYSNVSMTSQYIDSIRMEMDKLDNMDPNNVEVIKQLFLYKGIGDSVFNKINRSYSLTIDMAPADTMKTRLRKAQETYSENNKRQFFELTGPLSANMILYGIESELIKDANSCLTAYTTK